MTEQITLPEKKRLILVDDDAEICSLLGKALEAEGFDVQTCDSAAVMRETLDTFDADLIVMDLMMPGEDGITATRALRTESSIPVLMLTAKGDEVDRIIGLEMGADDYMSKPFNVRELVARIRAILRRTQQGLNPMGAAAKMLAFEGWNLSVNKRDLYRENGDAVPLTSGEFELLHAFLSAPGRVLSRDFLLEQTKGRQMHAFDRSVDIQVSRLRNKIEVDPKNPQFIKTIRSGGYMFTAQVQPS